MAFVHPEKQPSGLQQTGLWVALRQAELQVQVGSLGPQERKWFSQGSGAAL